MRSGSIHAVGRCGCAPSRREPQADGSAWRCSTLMVLFVMIPFFLFSSRAGRRIRELHERLLELLIMISFVGRDLSEHLRDLLVARFLRVIGETDVHLRVLVVL